MRIPRDEKVEGLGRIRLYDSGPRFVDRYTILFMDEPVGNGEYQGIAFGEDVGPQGFSQYTECRPLVTYGRGAQARRKRFDSLNERLQAHVRQRVS